MSSGDAVARAWPTLPPIEALRAAAAAALASRGEVPKSTAPAVGVPTAEVERGVVPEPRPPKLPTGVALPDFSPLPLPLRATPQNSRPFAFARASPTGKAREPRCSHTRARRSGTANEPIIAPPDEDGAASSLLMFSAAAEVEGAFSTTARPATPARRIAARASIAGVVGGTVTTLPSAQPDGEEKRKRKKERERVLEKEKKKEREREREREREEKQKKKRTQLRRRPQRQRTQHSRVPEHEPRGVQLRDDVSDTLLLFCIATAFFNLFGRQQRDSVRDALPRSREPALPDDAHGDPFPSDEEAAEKGAEGHRGGEGGSRSLFALVVTVRLVSLVVVEEKGAVCFFSRVFFSLRKICEFFFFFFSFSPLARSLPLARSNKTKLLTGPDDGKARQRHLAQLGAGLLEDLGALEELGAVERALWDDLEETCRVELIFL